MVKKIKLFEIFDAPKLYDKNQMTQNILGTEVVIDVKGRRLDIYTMDSPLLESNEDARTVCANLPPEIKNKVKVKAVNFAIDGEMELAHFKDPSMVGIILSQVRFFIMDILEPFTLIEMFPADYERGRKAYVTFAKNIHRFIHGLKYIPNPNEIWGMGYVATEDLANALTQSMTRVPEKKTGLREILNSPKLFTKDQIATQSVARALQKTRLREIFDAKKLYKNLNVFGSGPSFVSGGFKVGKHTVEICADFLPKTRPEILWMIKVEQGLPKRSYATLSLLHWAILNEYCPEPKDLKIYEFLFSVDHDFARSQQNAPTFMEGLVIIKQVIIFLNEMMKKLGLNKVVFLRFYPYSPTKGNKKAYSSFYNTISKTVPGMVPIQVRKAFLTNTPEFVIGTAKARKLLDKLVAVPLDQKKTEQRIKELFDSNIPIKWHPENDNYTQVAFFQIQKLVYVFRAMETQQKEVGIEYIKNNFNVPDSVRTWKVGFSYVDTELFEGDTSPEDIFNASMDELLTLIDKNYLTGVGHAAEVMTALVKILKELHNRFPDDIITFRGTEEKSRNKVYILLVKNTKRFVPDCTGEMHSGYFYIIPDKYTEEHQ